MYQFLLNMWILNRINEAYLDNQVTLGRITQQEVEKIIAYPQIH